MSDASPPTLGAVVLAAGLSSRMAGFKPLVPLSGRAPLERLVTLFRDAGVTDVVVVTGHRCEEVCRAARALGARVTHNAGFHTGMFSSVQAGVMALGQSTHAFFLLPVDIPLVRPWTITRLARALRPETLVAHPTFLGERGHPPLISARLRRAIRDADGSGGLRAVLDAVEADTPEAVLEVSTPDEGVLLDMDTDADLARLEERSSRPGLPSDRECLALWEEVALEDRARRHCQAVAEAAVAMGRALNAHRPPQAGLDLGLIRASALVHDLAKGSPRHESLGGELLMERGYGAVAPIVTAHRDLSLAEDEPVTEREVVFLADKLLGGERLMTIGERYGQVLERHGHEPEAREAILGRMARAELIYGRIGAEAGQDPLRIVADAREAA